MFHPSFPHRIIAFFRRVLARDDDGARLLCTARLYTSPNGNAREAILRTLEQARESVDIGMYVLTDKDLTNALIALHTAGIRVRIILDRMASFKRHSKAGPLEGAGIPVTYIGYRRFHHKFAVVDGRTVLFGSANWTASGLTGNGDAMLVVNSRRLARQFKRIMVQYQP